jgi:hypothetical protein
MEEIQQRRAALRLVSTVAPALAPKLAEGPKPAAPVEVVQAKAALPVANENVNVPKPFGPGPSIGPGFTSRTHLSQEAARRRQADNVAAQGIAAVDSSNNHKPDPQREIMAARLRLAERPTHKLTQSLKMGGL